MGCYPELLLRDGARTSVSVRLPSGSDSTIVQVTQADDNTVTITALQTEGTATVTITATDEDGLTAKHVIVITVQAQDTSPVLPSVSDKTYDVGAAVNERLPAATGGNGSLAYSLTPSIPGLTFDAGTRTLC